MAYDVFDIPMQDRLGKQQFFYNAFRALWYNRISGDYAEFGCWSGSTFWLARRTRRAGATSGARSGSGSRRADS